MNPLSSYLQPLPLIAVLRGITPEEIPSVGGALAGAGFRVLEVPLNSPRPFDSIAALADEFGDRCLVGAGTVTAESEVNEVAAAYRTRWSGIQDWFADEPRQAVEEADVLVAKTIRRLVERFAAERRSLEAQLEHPDRVSSEELHQAMRRYRSFFERVLSA